MRRLKQATWLDNTTPESRVLVTNEGIYEVTAREAMEFLFCGYIVQVTTEYDRHMCWTYAQSDACEAYLREEYGLLQTSTD